MTLQAPNLVILHPSFSLRISNLGVQKLQNPVFIVNAGSINQTFKRVEHKRLKKHLAITCSNHFLAHGQKSIRHSLTKTIFLSSGMWNLRWLKAMGTSEGSEICITALGRVLHGASCYRAVF
jgi:hypothetical protein